MSYRFNPGTSITVAQVFGNSLTHARPPVIPANEFIGGSSFRVSWRTVIMVGIDNFSIQIFVIRDVEEAITIEKVIVDSALA